MLNYSVSVTGAFLLFCLYLRWQPWHSRLHLPFFVLWSPFIGVVLSNIPKHKIINSVFVFIIFASLSYVFFSNARPLLRGKNIFNTTRIDQYFKTRPEIKETYMRMSKAVNDSGCSNVGLSLGVDDWEYPFWVLLQRHNRNFRIEHVNVDNVSQKKAATPAFETFSPCYIISP